MHMIYISFVFRGMICIGQKHFQKALELLRNVCQYTYSSIFIFTSLIVLES